MNKDAKVASIMQEMTLKTVNAMWDTTSVNLKVLKHAPAVVACVKYAITVLVARGV